MCRDAEVDTMIGADSGCHPGQVSVVLGRVSSPDLNTGVCGVRGRYVEGGKHFYIIVLVKREN